MTSREAEKVLTERGGVGRSDERARPRRLGLGRRQCGFAACFTIFVGELFCRCSACGSLRSLPINFEKWG